MAKLEVTKLQECKGEARAEENGQGEVKGRDE